MQHKAGPDSATGGEKRYRGSTGQDSYSATKEKITIVAVRGKTDFYHKGRKVQSWQYKSGWDSTTKRHFYIRDSKILA